MYKFRLHITPKDIKEGTRGNFTGDPVYRALKRKFNREVVVTGRFFRFADNFDYYPLPEKLTNFIWHYDEGKITSGRYSFTIEMRNYKPFDGFKFVKES